MTIYSQHSYVSYIADGTQTTFAYDFKIYDEDDIKVYHNNQQTAIDNSLYTVKIDSDTEGGRIIYKIAPADGTIIEISRYIDLEQTVVYPVAGAFPPKTHEKALDRLTMIVQQQQRTIDEGSSYIPITGIWQPDYYYYKNQFTTTDTGDIYLCNITHTSDEESFDTDLNNGYWTFFTSADTSYNATQAKESADDAAEVLVECQDIQTQFTQALSDVQARGISYSIVDTNTSVSGNNGYLIDTSNGSVILTFPSIPNTGDIIEVVAVNTDNDITINPNGKAINGSTSNIVWNQGEKEYLRFVYVSVSEGWVLLVIHTDNSDEVDQALIDIDTLEEKVGSGVLGVDQEWDEYISERSSNVIYTNSTDRPIAISVYVDAVTYAHFDIAVDNIRVFHNINRSTTSYSLRNTGTAIVPAGSIYKVSCGSGTSLLSWKELR